MSDETVLSQPPDAGAVTEQAAPQGEVQPEVTPTPATEASEQAPTEGEVGKAEKPSVEFQPFTLPEGMELDAGLLEKATNAFKQAGISQEHAQQLIDLYAGQVALVEEKRAAQIAEWADMTKKDAELGGAEYDAKVSVARKAVRQFGSPELMALFDESGVGNHPELVRFAYRVGKALGEAPFVQPGTAAGPSEQDVLASLYPTMFPKND